MNAKKTDLERALCRVTCDESAIKLPDLICYAFFILWFMLTLKSSFIVGASFDEEVYRGLLMTLFLGGCVAVCWSYTKRGTVLNWLCRLLAVMFIISPISLVLGRCLYMIVP